MNKIITYVKYNKKLFINLILLIMVIIGRFSAIKYIK